MALGNAAFWPLEAANGVLVQSAKLAARNIRTTVVISLILICGSFAAAAALQMRLDRVHALNQASFYVRRVIIPGAGHFFVTDPVDDTSFGGFAGPRVLRFLEDIKF